MDSSNKDDKAERRREEALARRMGEALDRLALHNADDCPDAEVMAAYHDRALDSNETLRCETHFAGCARCRKILALLAASDDAPLAETEVAHLGKLIADSQAPRDAALHRSASPVPIKSAWKARWLAPALGIAAVLALWFAVKPPWRGQEQTSTTTLIAQAPRSEPPQNPQTSPVQEFSKVAPRKKSEPESGDQKDQSAGRNEVSNPGAERLSKRLSESGAAIGRVAPAAGIDALDANRESKNKAGTSTSTGVALPPPAPSLQAEVRRDAAPMEAPRASIQSGVVNRTESAKESADAAESTAPKNQKQELIHPERPLNGRDYSALVPLASTVQPNILLRPPQGLILWRVGRGGSIERSIDAGGSWMSQETPSKQDWVAGAAVSDKVCWIAGRNGAIARTTDGEHWENILSPAAGDASGKLPDWTGVTASDSQAAVLTAIDQRRFSTRDGGKTWQEQ